MDAVGLVSATVSVAGAVLTAFLGYWYQQRARRLDRRSYMDRYGAHMAMAAFDLQSRIFNILHGHRVDAAGKSRGFLTAFVVHGAADDAEYARRSTAFVFAEYLAWVEILRQDVQFLDLGRNQVNRDVMRQISRISGILSGVEVGQVHVGSEFRIFKTAQRAIGEVMARTDGETGRRRCCGYAEFDTLLNEDASFRRWFTPLLNDVDRVAAAPEPALPRLTELQHRLVELIDLLDPRFVRFRREHRSRFASAAAPGGSGG
ncbi:hypothetical protein [Micromonospora coxensis]|uniref:hypothetical protein n=1 Tax=Micromonospora coxensis TaxID=356852 RepID=UPI003441680E